MLLIAFGLIPSLLSWAAAGNYRLGLVLAVTGAFAALGYLVRGVTWQGAVAGAVVCFALFAAVGPGAFAALLILFGLTWTATRLGRARKERLGTAERGEGRTASQVLANLSVASACSIWYGMASKPYVLVAMAAALSEAAADTVSSECGQAFRDRAFLITTFESVPAGTDGGITLLGTLAGTVAAMIVGLGCSASGLISLRGLGIATAAAVIGMLADSYLGAQFERKNRLSNDAVNVLGTMVAAVIALVALRVLP